MAELMSGWRMLQSQEAGGLSRRLKPNEMADDLRKPFDFRSMLSQVLGTSKFTPLHGLGTEHRFYNEARSQCHYSFQIISHSSLSTTACTRKAKNGVLGKERGIESSGRR